MSMRATNAPALSSNSLLRNALIILVGSLVANHLIRIVAVALTNPIPEFLPLTTWGPVTIFTLLGVAGALGVYALLRRFTANPGRIFTIVAWVVLIISLIPNLLSAIDPSSAPLPGMTAGGALALALMHLPPALLAISLLPRSR
jgi:hypothetical protein